MPKKKSMKPVEAKQIPYWWPVFLGLLWPLAHIAVFLIRFPDKFYSGILAESLVFYPMGLLSFLFMAYLANKNASARKAIITGYFVAVPFAFIVSLFIGLLFIPLIGVTVAGTAVLALGSWIGLRLKK